jgi:hypothetical protein
MTSSIDKLIPILVIVLVGCIFMLIFILSSKYTPLECEATCGSNAVISCGWVVKCSKHPKVIYINECKDYL